MPFQRRLFGLACWLGRFAGVCATGTRSPLGEPSETQNLFTGRIFDGCTRQKCFCVTFDKSNKIAVFGEKFLNIAMSGVNKNYVPYLALKQRRGEKTYDKTNNQWHDRSRLTGS